MSTVSRWIKISGTGSMGPAGPPGPGGVVAGTVGSVVVTELGPRVVQPDQSTHTTLRVAMSIAGGTDQQYVTLYLTYNGGTTYAWQGYWTFYESTTGYIDLDFLIYTVQEAGVSSNNVLVYAVAAQLPGGPTQLPFSSLPVGGVLSAPITVLLASPVSTGMTAALQNIAGSAATASNIYAGLVGNDSTLQIAVALTLPSPLDPNVWFYQITVDSVDALGNENPNSTETVFDEVVNFGQTALRVSPQWVYPTFGSVYSYIRYRIYGINRNNQASPAFTAVDGSATLMNCWTAGATHQDLNLALSVTAIASEIGPRYQDPLEGLHTVIEITPTVAVGGLPIVISFWIDYDDGNGPQLLAVPTFSASVTTYTVGQPTLNTTGVPTAGGIWVPGLAADVNWTLYAAPGFFTTALPPVGAASYGFTVPAVGACPASDIENAQFNTDPNTGDILDYLRGSPGIWLWRFYQLQFDQPSLADDVSFWFAAVTVEDGYTVSGTGTVSGGTTLTRTSGGPDVFSVDMVGDDIHVNGVLTTIAGYTSPTVVTLATALSNGAGQAYEVWIPAAGEEENPGVYQGKIWNESVLQQGGGATVYMNGDYPADWLIHDSNDPKPINKVRVRLYAVSRLGTSPSNPGPGTYTLQTTCWPGSADHFDLEPTAQAAILDLTQTLPASVSGPITGGGGSPLTIGPNTITNPYIGPASIQATNMAANAITAANGAIAVNAVVDSNVASVNVSKLIAGTVIFTGTVYLSKGISQPILELDNTGIFIYGVANGSGTAGLTSQPFVSVTNGGIGVFQSTTGPSVIVGSGIVTIWSANGNSSDPYLTIGTGQMQMKSGIYTATVSPSKVELTDGTNFVTISTNLTIVNGNYSMKLTSSSLVLDNNAGSTVTVSSTGVAIVNGSVSATNSSFTLNIDSTNWVKISDSSLSIYSQIGENLIIVSDNSGAGVAEFQVTKSGSNYRGTMTLVGNESGDTHIRYTPTLSGTALAGSATLPSAPAGFIVVNIAGADKNIAYYN